MGCKGQLLRWGGVAPRHRGASLVATAASFAPQRDRPAVDQAEVGNPEGGGMQYETKVVEVFPPMFGGIQLLIQREIKH